MGLRTLFWRSTGVGGLLLCICDSHRVGTEIHRSAGAHKGLNGVFILVNTEENWVVILSRLQ